MEFKPFSRQELWISRIMNSHEVSESSGNSVHFLTEIADDSVLCCFQSRYLINYCYRFTIAKSYCLLKKNTAKKV